MVRFLPAKQSGPQNKLGKKAPQIIRSSRKQNRIRRSPCWHWALADRWQQYLRACLSLRRCGHRSGALMKSGHRFRTRRSRQTESDRPSGAVQGESGSVCKGGGGQVSDLESFMQVYGCRQHALLCVQHNTHTHSPRHVHTCTRKMKHTRTLRKLSRLIGSRVMDCALLLAFLCFCVQESECEALA